MKNLIVIVSLLLAATNLYAQENASNPLAAVNNTDLRFQYFDLDESHLSELWVDGAYMLTPKLKFKYELHYWDTDVNGTSVSDFQSFHVKPIYFPIQGAWGSWKYKLAIGFEWIVGLAKEETSIQLEGKMQSDQIAPLAGLALVNGNTVLVPLVQHFWSYNGPDVSTTAIRLIAIQTLAKNFWGKLDAIVPIEWKNDNAVPATLEVQLGKMFSPLFGIYVHGALGIGGDKPYEWGTGVGVRLNY